MGTDLTVDFVHGLDPLETSSRKVMALVGAATRPVAEGAPGL